MTRIVLALNVEDRKQAVDWLDRLGNAVDVYKLGMDLYTKCGPDLVREFVGRGAEVFLDLKFSDIPSVVGKAVAAAAELDVSMLTVHTMGGLAMLGAAADAASRAKGRKPLVLGVTVLTSIDEAGLERISGLRQPVVERVRNLALMARQAGCGGCVCSPQEISVIREACGREFGVVTPGIRLGPAKGKDDQARTLTPREAARAGADYIVVGRPITDAADPRAAVEEIRAQLGGGNGN
jgi:orotidine-5'-phosphate decarboxylase